MRHAATCMGPPITATQPQRRWHHPVRVLLGVACRCLPARHACSHVRAAPSLQRASGPALIPSVEHPKTKKDTDAAPKTAVQ